MQSFMRSLKKLKAKQDIVYEYKTRMWQTQISGWWLFQMRKNDWILERLKQDLKVDGYIGFKWNSLFYNNFSNLKCILHIFLICLVINKNIIKCKISSTRCRSALMLICYCIVYLFSLTYYASDYLHNPFKLIFRTLTPAMYCFSFRFYGFL